MATIAERHDAITPPPLPNHEAPLADTGLMAAIVFAAVFYLVAMLGTVMLRDGKELA